MAIVRDRELLGEKGEVPISLMVKCLAEHQKGIERLNRLEKYYNGEHIIMSRSRSQDLPNNKLVCNHAEYITDMATGYFIGNKISYKGSNVDGIMERFKINNIHAVDTNICKSLSIFGAGYELIYMSNDESPVIQSVYLDPRKTMLVVDNTVERNPMFAVYYSEKIKDDGQTDGYYVNLYTDKQEIRYYMKDITSTNTTELEAHEHFFGEVPVIEYLNKSNAQGDFEGVISLIDAYNLLQSDRTNDKEQQVDSLLVLKGTSMGDDYDEASKNAKMLKEQKMLELPTDGNAAWLSKALNETEVEVLKNAIKNDIHEFSKIPCLTDENFASNASGVAMKYKLLGLEQLAKIKEGYYFMGLRKRLRLYAKILNIKSKNPDQFISDIEVIMVRSSPVNELEVAQLVSMLDGQVSHETRISLLPFVSDVSSELEKVALEKNDEVEKQRRMMGYDIPIIPTDENDEHTEEKEDVSNEE